MDTPTQNLTLRNYSKAKAEIFVVLRTCVSVFLLFQILWSHFLKNNVTIQLPIPLPEPMFTTIHLDMWYAQISTIRAIWISACVVAFINFVLLCKDVLVVHNFFRPKSWVLVIIFVFDLAMVILLATMMLQAYPQLMQNFEPHNGDPAPCAMAPWFCSNISSILTFNVAGGFVLFFVFLLELYTVLRTQQIKRSFREDTMDLPTHYASSDAGQSVNGSC